MHFYVTEQHKKSVQRYHQQLREEADSASSVQETEEQMSDQQVWKKTGRTRTSGTTKKGVAARHVCKYSERSH